MKSLEALLRNSHTVLLRRNTSSALHLQLQLQAQAQAQARAIVVAAARAHSTHSTSRTTPRFRTSSPHRWFSTTGIHSKGLQPDTSEPVPPNPEPSGAAAATNVQPAPISESEYHDLSEQYIDNLQKALEERAEDASAGIELEYAAGVLNITTPQGVYVINKQPPNKQLWLSSPISGPKRYDWVVTGTGQNTKEGTETDVGDDGVPGGGKWVYLRDGSTLSGLLKDEINAEVGSGIERHIEGTTV